MATIRNQRNHEQLVLVLGQDLNQRIGAVAQASRDSGSFYLPSVTGSMRMQPFPTGCAQDARPDHAKEKTAWSGCWLAGCRAASALVIN